MKYHYTDKEIKALLDSIVILVDSRENQWKHIEDYFIKKKINYNVKALSYGDYSAYLPANFELGIIRDTYFIDTIAIERKNGLTELSNNLSNDRERFISELIRAQDTKLFLMVEDVPNGYGDILNHKYNTKYNEKSYVATLKSFESQFNINIAFMSDNTLSGFFIFSTLYYTIRNYLKRG
jgi:ERCC4-type nuclease